MIKPSKWSHNISGLLCECLRRALHHGDIWHRVTCDAADALRGAKGTGSTSLKPCVVLPLAAGQGRRKGGKRRKGGPPRPPPLLLVQDAQAAQTRVQERVAALLLRQRAPSPPTPPRSPSRLRSAAPERPLWGRSALRDGDPRGPAQFYTPELRDLLLPREPPGVSLTRSGYPIDTQELVSLCEVIPIRLGRYEGITVYQGI